MASSQRGGTSAVELKAELDQRLIDDAGYRIRIEAENAERSEETARLREAEQPVIADLAALGIHVDSVWNLYKLPDSRSQAIPVLLDHLTRNYPDKVLEGIAAGLVDKAAREWWPQIKAIYLQTENEAVRDRLAAVLSRVATRAHYDDLLSFLETEALGDTRIYFLRPVNRIGNRISSGQGVSVIQALKSQRPFGQEAHAILKGWSRNQG